LTVTANPTKNTSVCLSYETVFHHLTFYSTSHIGDVCPLVIYSSGHTFHFSGVFKEHRASGKIKSIEKYIVFARDIN